MRAKLKDIVKQHRKHSGLSQAELAKLAGVGKTVVYDVEHGKETIQFDTLLKICRVLNISISFHGSLSSDERNPGNRPG